MTIRPKFDIQKLQEQSLKISAILRALSNPDRLLILAQLANRESCVGELEEVLQIQQPTLSQQLGVLRLESLVSTRRDGRKIYYRLAAGPIIELLKSLQIK
ncbi:DNA-binding transcriptional ArsR family regulator [Oxalobacteraceae bacterium GrIS 2.11]